MVVLLTGWLPVTRARGSCNAVYTVEFSVTHPLFYSEASSCSYSYVTFVIWNLV